MVPREVSTDYYSNNRSKVALDSDRYQMEGVWQGALERSLLKAKLIFCSSWKYLAGLSVLQKWSLLNASSCTA